MHGSCMAVSVNSTSFPACFSLETQTIPDTVMLKISWRFFECTKLSHSLAFAYVISFLWNSLSFYIFSHHLLIFLMFTNSLGSNFNFRPSGSPVSLCFCYQRTLFSVPGGSTMKRPLLSHPCSVPDALGWLPYIMVWRKDDQARALGRHSCSTDTQTHFLDRTQFSQQEIFWSLPVPGLVHLIPLMW